MQRRLQWSNLHDLTEENILKYATTDAGVYLLWLKIKHGKWRCYYVGQADNIEERLLRHISMNEDNSGIRRHIRENVSGFEYAKVAKESDREGIEKFLYDHFHPECNQADPGGNPIEVNLP